MSVCSIKDSFQLGPASSLHGFFIKSFVQQRLNNSSRASRKKEKLESYFLPSALLGFFNHPLAIIISTHPVHSETYIMEESVADL